MFMSFITSRNLYDTSIKCRLPYACYPFRDTYFCQVTASTKYAFFYFVTPSGILIAINLLHPANAPYTLFFHISILLSILFTLTFFMIRLLSYIFIYNSCQKVYLLTVSSKQKFLPHHIFYIFHHMYFFLHTALHLLLYILLIISL